MLSGCLGWYIIRDLDRDRDASGGHWALKSSTNTTMTISLCMGLGDLGMCLQWWVSAEAKTYSARV